jgi:hypothetical protein
MQIMVNFRTKIMLILMLASTVLQAQTTISGGSVSGDWEASGNPYIIEGNITVDPDERLTIKQGVEVLFSGNFALEIYGRLEVDGTEETKVLFSLADTSGFATGTAGWSGIAFLGFYSTTTELSTLNHCIVEYSAGNGVTCLEYSNLEVNHAEIRYNRYKGLAIYEFSNINVHGIEVHHNGTGGMDIQFSSPQMSDFLIEHNGGSGIFMMGSSYNAGDPIFENGTIRFNQGLYNGGGLSLNMDAFLSLKGVDIHDNSAELGGGVFTSWAYLMMEEVHIHGNQAIDGGGIYGDMESNLEMTHCLVADNEAQEDGGGISLVEADLEISRSTIAGNTAGNNGGAIHCQMYYGEPGSISNSILWGNYPDEISAGSIAPEVYYSNVYGGYAGDGNIDANPLFESVETGNYHLSWEDYPYASGAKSPCIDAGDPASAYDPDGTVADMGAFYYHQETVTLIRDQSEEAFKMFPNPATHSVQLTADETIQYVQVLNLAGKVVKKIDINDLAGMLVVSDIPGGIYLVRVMYAGGNRSTQKLVRE